MFIEVSDVMDSARHSVNVNSIIDVLEDVSEKRTHIFLNYSLSRQGFDKDGSPVIHVTPGHLYVYESYDEVMYQIRSALNAT